MRRPRTSLQITGEHLICCSHGWQKLSLLCPEMLCATEQALLTVPKRGLLRLCLCKSLQDMLPGTQHSMSRLAKHLRSGQGGAQRTTHDKRHILIQHQSLPHPDLLSDGGCGWRAPLRKYTNRSYGWTGSLACAGTGSGLPQDRKSRRQSLSGHYWATVSLKTPPGGDAIEAEARWIVLTKTAVCAPEDLSKSLGGSDRGSVHLPKQIVSQ